MVSGLVDIWNPISHNVSLIDHADLMVAPKHAGHVKHYLKCSGMKVQVISDNLQRQIDEENIVQDTRETIVTRPGMFLIFISLYQSYSKLNACLRFI